MIPAGLGRGLASKACESGPYALFAQMTTGDSFGVIPPSGGDLFQCLVGLHPREFSRLYALRQRSAVLHKLGHR